SVIRLHGSDYGISTTGCIQHIQRISSCSQSREKTGSAVHDPVPRIGVCGGATSTDDFNGSVVDPAGGIQHFHQYKLGTAAFTDHSHFRGRTTGGIHHRHHITAGR